MANCSTPSKWIRPFPILFGLAILVFPAAAALADGSVSGQVHLPEGTPTADIRVVLVAEKPDIPRRSVKLTKKNEYFFGMVPEGKYTLAVEGTSLVVRSISVRVIDTETHKDVLSYEGPAPSQPQVFDVSLKLKDTYDITLGAPAPAAAAAGNASGSPDDAVAAKLQAQDYAGTITAADALLAGKPDDAVLHYYKGFAQFKLKDYEHARTEVSKALELNPKQIGGHWVLGATLASEGKKPEAIAEFQKELDNADTDAATRLNSYINIGILQRDLGNREAAITAFEKVIELDSHQTEAYSYLADLYLATGKTEKAEEIQARSRTLGLEDPKAIFNVGAAHWNKKEFDKAEAAFRRAVELDPQFALAWKNLGYTLVNLGKTDEAAAALKRYLELAPDADDAKEVRELVAAMGKTGA